MEQKSYRRVHEADSHSNTQFTMLHSIRELPSMAQTALLYLEYAWISN